jgi:triacylglycerol lipase
VTLPILLAHGIARFDFIARQLDLFDGEEKEDDRAHYFRRIRSTLRAAGFDAHHSDVPYAAGVHVRARHLLRNVEQVLRETGAPRLHIIAHSMGGLDARHMLFEGRDLRVHERVASLTTIGTPHLGTSFADWGVRRGAEALALLEFLGIDSLDGFQDLTTDACREFDAKARPFEEWCGVEFQTYAGTQELRLVFAPLQVPWFVIHENEGANDGLVSLESARWRAPYFKDRLDADHLNQVGWWDPNEAARFFPSLGGALLSRRRMEERIRELYLSIARGLS